MALGEVQNLASSLSDKNVCPRISIHGSNEGRQQSELLARLSLSAKAV